MRQARLRPLWVTLGVAVAACDAGGGSGGHGGPAPDGTATLQVGIVYVGGPATTTDAPLLLRPGKVTLRPVQGGTSYGVPVSHDRRSPVRVRSGSYVVTAVSGDAACMESQVVAADGPALDVTVSCSVK